VIVVQGGPMAVCRCSEARFALILAAFLIRRKASSLPMSLFPLRAVSRHPVTHSPRRRIRLETYRFSESDGMMKKQIDISCKAVVRISLSQFH
jgi:hypothetical protein